MLKKFITEKRVLIDCILVIDFLKPKVTMQKTSQKNTGHSRVQGKIDLKVKTCGKKTTVLWLIPIKFD